MVVFGTLINTGNGTMSAFDLAFTGQYLNTTIAAVEAAGATPAGVFSDSWSGTADVTATSEPGSASTMLLAGGGLIALRLRRRRGV
jgi:MYXO-CTERM domain-containing protein